MLADYVVILDGQGTIVSGTAPPQASGESEAPEFRKGAVLLDVLAANQNSADAETISQGLASVLEGERAFFEHDFHVSNPAGDRWLLLRIYSLRPEREGAVAIHLDMTNRRFSAISSDTGGSYAQALMNSTADCVYAKDAEGRYTHANRAVARFLGLPSPDAVIGKTDHDLFDQACADRICEDDRQVLHDGTPIAQKLERVSSPTDNAERWVATSKEPIRNDAGAIVGLVGIARDVTAYKQLEERLRALVRCFLDFQPDPEQNLSRIVGLCGELLNAPRGIYLRTAADGSLVSRAAFGFAAEEMPAILMALGAVHPVLDKQEAGPIVVADLAASPYAAACEPFTRLGVVSLVGQAVRLDGTVAGALYLFFDQPIALPEQDRELLAFCVRALVGEERRAEAEQNLVMATNRLDEAQRLAHIGNWEANLRTGALYWSDELYRITGLPAGTPPSLDTWEDLFHPADRPVVRAALTLLTEHVTSLSLDVRVLRANHELRYCTIRAQSEADGSDTPIRVYGTAMDITDRMRADTALHAAARLESTAALASGIAHDFNNLMATVMGNAELMQMELQDNPDQMGMLSEIVDSARSAGNLAQKMLAFAQGGKMHPQLVDLNDVVREAMELHGSSVPDRVTVEASLASGLWRVKADPAHLCQVVIDLCVNAVESIEGEGTLSLSTANLEVDADMAKTVPEVHPGRHVCLTVSDTGCGMDRSTRSRIFEPFFSTKFQGRGMSMAAAYGIISRFGGAITVESNKEQGSAFRVFLPAVAVSDEANPAIKDMLQGDETILVVDDEPTVLAVTRKLLERLGYHVLLAENGRQAVDVAQEHEGPIHLILLDMCMPVMDGASAFPLLRKALPNAKILICSGFDANRQVDTLLKQGASGFLHKPYRLQVLGPKIRELLGD